MGGVESILAGTAAAVTAVPMSTETKVDALGAQGTNSGTPTDQPKPTGFYNGFYEDSVASGGGAVKSLLQFFMGLFMFIIVVMVLAVLAYGAAQVMQAVARPLAKFLGTIK